MHLGLTYSVTCQIYLVIWDLPRSPPRWRYTSLSSPKKLIESSKIWSVKSNEVQLDRFFGWGGGYPDYYSNRNFE